MSNFHRFVFNILLKQPIMKGILGLITVLAFSFSVHATDCDKPMTKERFTSLYKTVEVKQDDHQRYQLIVAYAKRECMTVDQLGSFLDLIEEHKVKVSTVQSAYNHLFDIENVDKLTQGFTEHEKLVIQKVIKK